MLFYYAFALKFKKILRYVERSASKRIPLRLSEGETVQADSADILYVEVMQHYLIFHMKGGEKYRVRGTIGEAEELLAPYFFVRCAKSFLVNLRHALPASSCPSCSTSREENRAAGSNAPFRSAASRQAAKQKEGKPDGLAFSVCLFPCLFFVSAWRVGK